MLLVLLVAVVGKVVGCGLAALASGMDWVRSLRIGCGMMSRGEVGLIVTAMGASTGIFGRSEVAVMVAVVLLTTLLTPIALRGAFQLKSGRISKKGSKILRPMQTEIRKGAKCCRSVLCIREAGVARPTYLQGDKFPRTRFACI